MIKILELTEFLFLFFELFHFKIYQTFQINKMIKNHKIVFGLMPIIINMDG
jgi:hypothetical protein